MKEEILKYDPEFTESNFKTFIDNVFIQIHLSIMTKEIENIRHFVTEEIYEKIENKVKLLNEKNVIHIESVEIVEGKIIIQVKLISRYMDYLINEDGDYVSGNNTHRIQKENNLIFTKIIDAEKLKSVRKCPGCGVTLDINRSGKCEYCGSTFDLDKKGWILTTLEV